MYCIKSVKRDNCSSKTVIMRRIAKRDNFARAMKRLYARITYKNLSATAVNSFLIICLRSCPLLNFHVWGYENFITPNFSKRKENVLHMRGRLARGKGLTARCSEISCFTKSFQCVKKFFTSSCRKRSFQEHSWNRSVTM